MYQSSSWFSNYYPASDVRGSTSYRGTQFFIQTYRNTQGSNCEKWTGGSTAQQELRGWKSQWNEQRNLGLNPSNSPSIWTLEIHRRDEAEWVVLTMIPVAYLGFQNGGQIFAGHYNAYTNGINYIFLFISMEIFLLKGAMAQCPYP